VARIVAAVAASFFALRLLNAANRDARLVNTASISFYFLYLHSLKQLRLLLPLSLAMILQKALEYWLSTTSSHKIDSATIPILTIQ
jgi:hypothetical protein